MDKASALSTVILSASLSISVSLCAEPLVTSVSGEWSPGQELLISGSGFGGQGPRVILFDNFERSVPGEPVIDAPEAAQGIWPEGNRSHTFTADGAYSGKQAMVARQGTAIKGSLVGAVAGDGPHGYTTFQEVFYAVAIKDLGTFPDGTETAAPEGSATKDTWLMLGRRGDNSQFAEDGMGHDVYVPAYSGRGKLRIAGNTTKTDFWLSGKLEDWWIFQGWNRQSFYTRLSADNPYAESETAFRMVNQHGQRVDHYDGSLMSEQSGVIAAWDRVKFGAWYRGDEDTYRLMDDVYMAVGPGARARVEVCDTPRYDDCTRIGILLPRQWSPKQITARYLGSPITDADAAWLYVVDAEGAINGTGYPLSELQPTVARPGAPTNFQYSL